MVSAPRLRTLILLTAALNPTARVALCQRPDGHAGKITVAEVRPKSVVVRHNYRCTEYGQDYQEIRTPTDGYLAAVSVKEGQAVKKGDPLLAIRPPGEGEEVPGDRAREASASIGRADTPANGMFNLWPPYDGGSDAPIRDGVISIRAPRDGVIVRLSRKPGQFVWKGDFLATVVRTDVIWANFLVPGSDCVDCAAEWHRDQKNRPMKLILADRSEFPHAGESLTPLAGSSEGDTLRFNAKFPNPDGLPCSGRNGTVSVSREWKDAIVLPRRAAFRYRNYQLHVYVVDEGHVAHRRAIVIADETEELLVVTKGIEAGDRIVVDGVEQARDGDRVE